MNEELKCSSTQAGGIVWDQAQREERKDGQSPQDAIPIYPAPFTFSPGLSKTHAEQGKLGVSGQPLLVGKKGNP